MLVTFIFALHPGSIFYVTLQVTMLTSLLVTAVFYLLWRTKRQPEPVPSRRLSPSAILDQILLSGT
jgi:hypothetical protein